MRKYNELDICILSLLTLCLIFAVMFTLGVVFNLVYR